MRNLNVFCILKILRGPFTLLSNILVRLNLELELVAFKRTKLLSEDADNTAWETIDSVSLQQSTRDFFIFGGASFPFLTRLTFKVVSFAFEHRRLREVCKSHTRFSISRFCCWILFFNAFQFHSLRLILLLSQLLIDLKINYEGFCIYPIQLYS